MRIRWWGVIGLLLTAIAALPLSGSGDQAEPPKPKPPPAPHLAIQVREILRRHCFECHHAGPQGKANLNILDHVLLLDQERKLVIPRAPNRSRLLELIVDGSMPQKTQAKVPEAERQVLRAWIDAGARPFFPTHSESYVLARILDDIRTLEAKDRPHVRYLSLHHLLTEAEPRTELEAYRLALNRIVDLLPRPGPPRVKAIEPTLTVFRIDLRDLGWHEPMLTGTMDRAPQKPHSLNRFDLLVLDYPYAVLPEKSQDYAELGLEFLKLAPQVRPTPYVRGDWFITAALPLAGKAAAEDAAMARARQLFEARLGLSTAQAELDWTQPVEELHKVFAAPPLEKRGLAPLANGDTVRREVWEQAFDSVVRHLKLGTPVIPLDSTARPNYQPELDLWTEAPGAPGQRKSRFEVNERMVIVVKPEKDVYVELIWTNAEGKEYLLTPVGSRLARAGTAVPFTPGKEGYKIEPPRGKDRITVFACEVEQLVDEKDFPAGELFKGKDLPDRVIHPFYAGWYDDKVPRKLDPARLMKKTIEIEIK